jgi:hypothetical protein
MDAGAIIAAAVQPGAIPRAGSAAAAAMIEFLARFEER